MLTSLLVLVPVAMVGLSFALLAPVLYSLFRSFRIEDISPEWLVSFTPETYHPMERLLSGEDFGFLSRQPGFDLSLYRKLRRERLLIFRQYLLRLVADFNRLHATARYLVAHSSEDRSDLLLRLITLRAKFSFAVLQTEVAYYLCYMGYSSLAARAPIAYLEQMGSELTALSSSAAA